MRRNKISRSGRLLKNIALMFAGNFVTKILSFIMVPVYTSLLSTADYGVADLISTTVLLVLPIFSLLMEEATLRFALDTAIDNKQVFTIGVTISTFGFIAALLVSPVILFFESLRPYYVFVILYYISLWLHNIFSYYVRGLDKVAICTVASIIHTVVFLAINIIGLVVLRWGVYAYLLAIDVSNLIAAAFLFIYCKLYKNIIRVRNIDWKLAKEMIKFSVPMLPDYISWWLNNGLDRYMISFFCNNSVLGLYSVAHKIPTILSSLTSIFSSAWRISSVDDFGSQKSIEFYSGIYRLYSGFLIITSSVLIFVVKPIAKFLFAKDFFIAWKITPILILAQIFSALAIFIGSIFTASKKTQKLFIAPLIGAAVNLCLNLLFIPKFEAIGAAWATTIGYMAIWIIQMINTSRVLKIDLNLKVLVPSLLLIVAQIFIVTKDTLTAMVFAGICAVIVLAINSQVLLQLTKIIIDRIKGFRCSRSM